MYLISTLYQLSFWVKKCSVIWFQLSFIINLVFAFVSSKQPASFFQILLQFFTELNNLFTTEKWKGAGEAGPATWLTVRLLRAPATCGQCWEIYLKTQKAFVSELKKKYKRILLCNRLTTATSASTWTWTCTWSWSWTRSWSWSWAQSLLSLESRRWWPDRLI